MLDRPSFLARRPVRLVAVAALGAALAVPALPGAGLAAGPTPRATPNAACDPLDAAACLLPFPSDTYTVADPTTPTGRRVHLDPSSTPLSRATGQRIDVTEWNRSDGFSPGTPILTRIPGLDVEQSGIAPVTDIGRSLAPDAPIVLLNTRTGERTPYWAELDAQATSDSAEQLLIIRPAVNLDEATRYVVAIRNVKDATGAAIPPSARFAQYVNGEPADPHDPRRQSMKRLLAELTVAGVKRDDLYLAWDFTVASAQSTTGRMLHIRDDAFARLGDAAPEFVVTAVAANPREGITRQVTGTVTVPKYLTGSGGPGSTFSDPDGDGRPDVNGTWAADFVCNVSPATLSDGTDPNATVNPAQASLYGHGLLGRPTEINAGNVRAMSNEHDFVFCATSWIGMANADILYVAGSMADFSRFPAVADRLQQSMLNFLFLGRAMIHADGFASHPAFQGPQGQPLLDLADGLVYDGNSQGGIAGGALTAVAQDFTRAVLGVPGMNYSTLLNRSVDFDPFHEIMSQAYPGKIDQQLVFGLIQMLWDRAETNGYAHHMTDDPLPGTPAHQVLLHVAFGDHQVAPVSAEVEARTIGAHVHRPVVADGWSSDVEPAWGIPTLQYPHDGSALVAWNSGMTPEPPATNLAPRLGEDPHEWPRAQPAARQQKATFLTTGTVVNVCGDGPCGVTTAP